MGCAHLAEPWPDEDPARNRPNFREGIRRSDGQWVRAYSVAALSGDREGIVACYQESQMKEESPAAAAWYMTLHDSCVYSLIAPDCRFAVSCCAVSWCAGADQSVHSHLISAPEPLALAESRHQQSPGRGRSQTQSLLRRVDLGSASHILDYSAYTAPSHARRRTSESCCLLLPAYGRGTGQ